MRVGIALRVAFAAALCMICTSLRAEIAIYDFEGTVTTVLNRGAEHLPAAISPGAMFTGVLVVDLTQATGGVHNDGLIDISVRFANGELIALDPGSLHGIQLIDSSVFEIPPPLFELVTTNGRTPPRPGLPRGAGISLGWVGEPAAPAQRVPPGQDMDLSTLTPKQRWGLGWTTNTSSIANAVIATFHRRDAHVGDYMENFNDADAPGWIAASGQWAIGPGDYRNVTNGAFASSIQQDVPLPDEFVMLTDVYLSWGAPGNTAGVLFNYRNGANFYEVRLNAQGAATLNKVVGGVRRVVASGTYPEAGTRRWSTLYIKRSTTGAQIEINGTLVFDVALNELTGGSAGVFSSWNMARFDNVLIGAPVPGADVRFLSFGSPALDGFTPLSGTWAVTNGALRSSTNQASSIALYEPFAMREVYEIGALIRPQWFAAGNQSGFVYDYLDAKNWREGRVHLGPDRNGTLLLIDVVNGVRREVARKSFGVSQAAAREIRVRLTRERGLVIFGLEVQSSLYVQQAPRPGPTRVGLLTSWNLVSFDDVAIYRVSTQ